MSIINISLLYVEDEKTIRDYLGDMLSRQVAELHIAFDGKEGLELFKEKKPDVILTDIRMLIIYLLCIEVRRRRYDEINETVFVLKSPNEELIF